MQFASRLAILLYCFCISVPASSLLASKPRLEVLRPKIVNRMAEARLAVDLIVPAPTTIVKVNEKALISTIITASYMSIIVSVMALPVCLSAISADIAFYGAKTKSSYLSEVIFAATIAIMVGKFLLGPVTDVIGGDATMQVTMLVISALLFACSISTNIQVFGVCWIVINFVYASAWGAVSKIVRTKYSQGEWAKVLGLVAAGSRLGSMGSALLYGSILRGGIRGGGIMERVGLSAGRGDWRVIFKVSALIQGSALVLYVLCDRLFLVEKEKVVEAPTHPVDNTIENVLSKKIIPGNVLFEVPESIPQVLRRISRDRRFWLMLAGKVALMTVGQFISFIPLYLNTGHHMSDGEAAAKSAVFALGSLVSSVFGSRVYQSLSGKMQVKAVTVCNWFGFLLPALLTAHHYRGPWIALSAFLLSQSAVLGILGLWGMAWALPFYLPAGVLALTLGGITHAALLTNLFDAVGFFAASLLSYYAMELGRKNMWTPLLLSLCGAGGVALMTMSRSMSLSLSMTASSEGGKRRGD